MVGLAEINETPDRISLTLQCGETSDDREALRQYLICVERIFSVAQKVSESVEHQGSELTGADKVALAYRMLATNNLQNAMENIDIAVGVLGGEIDPNTTRFWDLLLPDQD